MKGYLRCFLLLRASISGFFHVDSTPKRSNINYNVSGLPPSWYTKSLVQFGFSKMAACWLLPFNLLGRSRSSPRPDAAKVMECS